MANSHLLLRLGDRILRTRRIQSPESVLAQSLSGQDEYCPRPHSPLLQNSNMVPKEIFAGPSV
jgi:hypothetical protein